MIPYLVTTTILNIGLGYWLAIYLGKGSAWAMGAKQPEGASNPTTNTPTGAQQAGGLDFAWPPAATAAATGTVGQAVGEGQASKDGLAPVHSEAPAAEKQDQPSAIEQELLAGIEEFRNQLAQLKSKGAFEPPVAAS